MFYLTSKPFELNNSSTLKLQNINIYFPIVNMFNICLQNIYIIILAIIFYIKAYI